MERLASILSHPIEESQSVINAYILIDPVTSPRDSLESFERFRSVEMQ